MTQHLRTFIQPFIPKGPRTLICSCLARGKMVWKKRKIGYLCYTGKTITVYRSIYGCTSHCYWLAAGFPASLQAYLYEPVVFELLVLIGFFKAAEGKLELFKSMKSILSRVSPVHIVIVSRGCEAECNVGITKPWTYQVGQTLYVWDRTAHCGKHSVCLHDTLKWTIVSICL